MESWVIWSILAGVLLILELMSGTFYLLMVCIGFASGAVLAFAGLSLATQLLGAALIGSGATIVLHKSRFGWRRSGDPSANPDINPDIGRVVQVRRWEHSEPGVYQTRISYRGANWDAQTHDELAVPGPYTIQRVEGSRLILTATAAANPAEHDAAQ